MTEYEYEFYIFDNDGVILRSLDHWFDSAKTINAEYNLKLDDRQLRIVMANFSKSVEFGLHPDHLKEYGEKIRVLATPGVRASPLYDHVHELLNELRLDGKELAVVSSDWEVRKSLEAKGILEFFPSVISGQDVKTRKPDPEGIEEVLKLMRGRRNGSAVSIEEMKTRAVMIGDAATDMEAAKRAGIRGIAVHDPNHHARFHDLADIMVHNPIHVVPNLLRLREVLTKSKNGR